MIEATKGGAWGKFLVAKYDTEWGRRSLVDTSSSAPLLHAIGQPRATVWVLDLQTCEGAAFTPGGLASADLRKHRVWVCPLFEPFLGWLYARLRDPADFDDLPELAELPDAPVEHAGYRRPGPPPGELSITCPKCGRVSHNPTDILEGYCGACGDWTGLWAVCLFPNTNHTSEGIA